MAPGSIVQAQFGGGIFRGRRAPTDSVYDAVNALVNDERELFRRGGSDLFTSSDAAGALVGLWDGQVSAGRRTLAWTAGALYATSSGIVLALLGAAADVGSPAPWARGTEVGGIVFFPDDEVLGREVVYAGSVIHNISLYTAGTITVTAGSPIVTGVGTGWSSSNLDAGTLLSYGSTTGLVVKSRDSATQLTLTKPAPASAAGVAYEARMASAYTPVVGQSQAPVHAAAGGRLLRCFGNRVYFSVPASDDAFVSGTYPGKIADPNSDYHELPQGATIIGADSIEDTAILFTTGGVWAISNMALDAFDDVGNVQHQVAQISRDLVLFGDAGIAAYEGALIVPAIDDAHAFTLGGAPIPVSQAIRPLYREYVEAGYKPGLAAVYRGHYFLPVLNSSDVLQDVLVCRLDLRDDGGGRRPAWTRWANHAAGGAYAVRVGKTARQPQLVGLSGTRVTDLTGCFDPDATRKDDADGTDHALTITSNDVDTGPGLRGNTVLSANVEYELVDAATDNPTMAFATATGAEGSSFTTATALATGASTGPESDGTTPVAFDIRRKVERIRWQFQTTGAAASAILRRVELKIRPSGRQ